MIRQVKFILTSLFFLVMIGIISINPAKGANELIDTLREKGVLTEKEALELKAGSKEKPGGILPLRKGRVKLGGELELEFIKSESNSASGNSNGRFAIDKFAFTPRVYLTDSITLKAVLEV